MNKICCIILISFILNIKTEAQELQQVSNVSGTNNYSVTLPVNAAPWLTPNDGTTPPLPKAKATSIFIEFGDGTFSFLPNGRHDFIPGNKEVITKATGVYGGGGKPPAHRIAASPTINPAASYSPMNILTNPSDILAIIPNIGSILANDTMIFVVTYRTKVQGATLLFLFNDNSATPVFEDVLVRQQMKDVHTNEKSFFLRTYTGENETSVANAAPFVQTARGQYSQYSNCLAVTGLNANGDEHNIFITLIPKDGLISTRLSETVIKAVLVWGSGKTEKTEKDINLPTGDLAHDPNYITVTPNCMLLPKAGKQLKYRVHFQNTGPGQASKVRVAVKIPGNVNMHTDITYDPNFYLVENGILNAATCTHPYSNNNPIYDSLVFEFIPNPSAPCTLEGMDATATNLCNTKTMGDFWFTINTNDQMPNILLAQASIVFYNSAMFGFSPNDPIITNTAVSQFSDCCECEKNCDPCKKRKGLWKWLFCKKCGSK